VSLADRQLTTAVEMKDRIIELVNAQNYIKNNSDLTNAQIIALLTGLGIQTATQIATTLPIPLVTPIVTAVDTVTIAVTQGTIDTIAALDRLFPGEDAVPIVGPTVIPGPTTTPGVDTTDAAITLAAEQAAAAIAFAEAEAASLAAIAADAERQRQINIARLAQEALLAEAQAYALEQAALALEAAADAIDLANARDAADRVTHADTAGANSDWYNPTAGEDAAILDVGASNLRRDQMALVHAGEAVIPKTFAEGIRSGEMVLSGQGGSSLSSGDVYVTVNVAGSVSAENDLASSIAKNIYTQRKRGLLTV
jgi:hypothetical protein